MANNQSSLLTKLQEDLKLAQLAREELKTSVLRMLLSAANYRRIELQRELMDSDLVGVIVKEVKQRKESIEAYRESRPELAQKETEEMKILSAYLPEPVSDEQVEVWVKEAIEATGASGIRDMGRVISIVKEKAGTGSDGARISEAVKSALGGTT